MSNNTKTVLIALAVLAVGAAYAWYAFFSPWGVSNTSNTVAERPLGAIPADKTGPFLVIEVEGEANGEIVIDLFEQAAPGHVERITTLAEAGAYDNVVFHRVIDGFMAQTGDVENGVFGDDMRLAGRGGSDLPDLQAEFTDIPYDRGIVGMARSNDPNSANSQFFIMFGPAPSLNGKYTVVGTVTNGIEVVDAIKRGEGPNGAILGAPDKMTTVTVTQARQ